MGYQYASELAQELSLPTALSVHFSTNCYPPVPRVMIPFAVEVLERATDELWDEPVELPDGVQWRGQDSMTVSEAIEALYLQAFVE